MEPNEKDEFKKAVRMDLLSAASTISIILDNEKLFEAAVDVLLEYREKKQKMAANQPVE